MKSSTLLARAAALAALLILLAPSLLADEKAVRIARYAVTRLIKERLGRSAQVVFERDSAGFLSFSESKVTGEGYVRADGRTRDFRYSVKVKSSTDEYRDVEVVVGRDKWTDDDRWVRPNWNDDYGWGRDRFVRFSRPYNYQRFDERTVSFRGEASGGRVRLRVYDWDGRKVLDRDLGVSRGEWWTTATFDRGTYKAVAEVDGARKEDTRYFYVQEYEPWLSDLKIERPTLTGLDGRVVELRGSSRAESVRVRLYDPRNRLVEEREVRVRNNRWSVQMRVELRGDYRARVENVRRKGEGEVRFRVPF